MMEFQTFSLYFLLQYFLYIIFFFKIHYTVFTELIVFIDSLYSGSSFFPHEKTIIEQNKIIIIFLII